MVLGTSGSLTTLVCSVLAGFLQMRKAANRMNFDFNKAEDEYIDGDEVVGLGTINKEGSGRLRLVASQQKVSCRAPRCGCAGLPVYAADGTNCSACVSSSVPVGCLQLRC